MSFLLNPYVYSSAQALRDFQGAMVLGEDFYTENDIYLGDDGEGFPIFGSQQYVAIGFNTDPESFRPGGITFGSLTPSSYGATSFNYFYYDATSGSLGNNAQLKMGRSGPDTTAGYPTINDYPLTPSPITTTVNVISLPLNIAGNLFETKYSIGTSVTLKFALRTDILATAGSGTVTVPTGATRAIIVATGGGGGGARVSTGGTRRGGGGGGTSISDTSVSSGDWGTTVSYTVGAGGAGRTSTNGSGIAGGASTFIGLGLVMTTNGGAGGTTTAVGAGGTASGGLTLNETGASGTTDGSYTTARDIAYGNNGKGGFGGAGGDAAPGVVGFVTIVWY